MKIAIEASLPYLRGVVEEFAEPVYIENKDFSPETIKGCEALIVRSITKCNEALLKDSAVRLITTATAGFDHIDTVYCEQKGIAWENAAGCNAMGVAVWVASALAHLALTGGFSWSEKTIGIVGHGHVGHRVEQVARALGLQVLLCDPLRAEQGLEGYQPLEKLLCEADVLTFHTPLTKAHQSSYPTYHLINEALLSNLPKRPVLINASRGSVADTQALLAARQSGLISYLCLDVWEGEPTISSSLLAVADIATPHIAGFSAEGKANGARICLEHIRDFFNLTIPHLESVVPAPLADPLLSLTSDDDAGIYQLLLKVFDIKSVERTLRCSPERFEQLRKEYVYPREFSAYAVKPNTLQQKACLQQLGFNLIG